MAKTLEELKLIGKTISRVYLLGWEVDEVSEISITLEMTDGSKYEIKGNIKKFDKIK